MDGNGNGNGSGNGSGNGIGIGTGFGDGTGYGDGTGTGTGSGIGGRGWRVGEVASATGLTVRALRYYEEIALVAPSGRSAAGHRRYAEPDLRRLHVVVALRSLGLPLADVAGVLEDFYADPRPLVRRQVDQLEVHIAAAQRLRRRLVGLLDTLDHAAEPSARTLVELIEEMIVMEDRLTPEQLSELTEGRRQMTERLSAEQFAELGEQRRVAMAKMAPGEFAAMARHRSALSPP